MGGAGDLWGGDNFFGRLVRLNVICWTADRTKFEGQSGLGGCRRVMDSDDG